jgi:hypothetical protein
MSTPEREGFMTVSSHTETPTNQTLSEFFADRSRTAAARSERRAELAAVISRAVGGYNPNTRAITDAADAALAWVEQHYTLKGKP